MEKLLKVTNALLAIIAVCLVLLVASVYRVNFVSSAHAARAANPQPVYLVYWDRSREQQLVVGTSGLVPTYSQPASPR